MGLGAKFIPSYESLIIGRLVNGIARGIAFSTMPVIVAETTCRRRIGVYQGPYTYGIFFGVMLGNLLGHYGVNGIGISFYCT